MKTIVYISFFILVVQVIAMAQEDPCPGSLNEHYLHANNIRAMFLPRGNKFYNGSTPGFNVPFNSVNSNVSSIFASSPWIGCFDDAGNYKASTETYPGNTNGAFSVGPLTYIGTPYPDSICSNFDRAWSVYAEEVLRHRNDFEDDGIIHDTLPSIFGWPGRHNDYFRQFNGFDLPEGDVFGYAPFEDLNWNNRYDPEEGEYPVLPTNYNSTVVPDQMLWMVFNDLDTSTVNAERPIRVEIQLLAYAFNCQDRSWLNDVIFNKYTIINRAVTSADSIFFGMWADYDLGCSADDFIGCDTMRHTEFVYNSDEEDGDNGNNCSTGAQTYGLEVSPIQSMTWLNYPMHSFISYNPTSSEEPLLARYRLMNGEWTDGTKMRASGDGYDEDSSSPVTKFQYHGDPRDVNEWTANNVFVEGMDVKSVSAISLGRMDPGSRKVVEMAYMFHYDPDADAKGQLTHMYNQLDSLRNFHPYDRPACQSFPLCLDEECTWPGDFDHNGRVDHEDYLAWGVMNNSAGVGRSQGLAWRGYNSDDWTDQYGQVNYKHGDADGNGVVDLGDIDVHTFHHLRTNHLYKPESNYPEGDDIELTATGHTDNISNLQVNTGRAIDNILGLSFDIEFDTTIYTRRITHIVLWPETDNALKYLTPNDSKLYHYACVQTNNTGIQLADDALLFRGVSSTLQLRPGKTAPDSTIIRLKNLKGIDPEGNDLHLGSEPIVIYKDGFVGTEDLLPTRTTVYPNPTDGFIQIDVDVESEMLIYSLQGLLIRHVTSSEVAKPVDVSELSPGLYMLRIIATGELLKLVVQ